MSVKIEVGGTYRFHSTVQYDEFYSPRHGQQVTVTGHLPAGSTENEDPDNEDIYVVAFPDGTTGRVWEGEISGRYEQQDTERAQALSC